ncbi:heterokaryon incompatibility protein-domain-containing protein [Cladorrhinum samala]|uniref:Heterokaryon incompatibility protein-domain-containing protein n=1 Tax=Cladorrhinum samala TaxID=585594 RepID=A0AAV9HKV4_9PEZI|nr:heterokaryon incompatibility protein-domain-containing protein [Cladorrhinum samala]
MLGRMRQCTTPLNLLCTTTYITFGNKESKFVLLQVSRLGELQTANLSANDWVSTELGHLEIRIGLGQEVCFSLLAVALRPASKHCFPAYRNTLRPYPGEYDVALAVGWLETRLTALYSMEAYAYEAFPDDTPSIRLVTLLASPHRESPLRCIILRFPLPSPTPYTALSYCWGVQEPTSVLEIRPDVSSVHGGRSLHIGPNLNTALHHIRDPVMPRTLWIDAICINQADDEEKSQQIPLMTQIYSGAAQVLAWIGESGEGGDIAMGAAVALSEELKKARDVAEGRLDPDSKEAVRMDSTKAFGHAEDLVKLLSRPFFRRVWIVQEIGKGGSRVVVQCGAHRITWTQLVEACALAIIVGALAYSPTVAEFIIMIDAARGSERCNLYERELEASISLLHLLCRYRQFDSTDPRDKVFALLNLTDDALTKDPRVAPDYHKTKTEVYTDVAVAIMEHEKNLDILRVPRQPGTEGFASGLPSWVPDWSLTSLTMSLDITALNQTSEFRPTPGWANEVPFRLSDDRARLTVRCVTCPVKIQNMGPAIGRIDSPVKILSRDEFLQRSKSEAEILLAWEDIAGAQPASWSRPYPSANPQEQQNHGREGGETVGEAYRRTLLFGREYHVENQSETCDRDFMAWSRERMESLRRLRRLGLLRFNAIYRLSLTLGMIKTIFKRAIFGLTNEIEYDGPSRFADELAASMVGRRFFITEDNLFGIGPGRLEKDDRIILIKGVSVPMVVRPTPGSSAGSVDWSVVGDCYVHSKKILYGASWSEGVEESVNLV